LDASIPACANYENATKVLSDIVSGVSRMTKELKFAEGGWYETRDGRTIYQIQRLKNALPFEWGSGRNSWRENGIYLRDGAESAMDLVRRVNPPTEYVPVKKWLWEREIGGVLVITKEPQVMPPELVSAWRRVEGSEVEE
jgi:hypothetical protein